MQENKSAFPDDTTGEEGLDPNEPTNAVPPKSVPVEDGLGEVSDDPVKQGPDHLPEGGDNSASND